MPVTISNAESAYLMARSVFGQFAKKWVAEWYKPYTDLQAAMLWQSIPDEIKAQMKQAAPEKYAKVEGMFDTMKGG